MIVLMLIFLVILIFNTALLLALCGAISKLIQPVEPPLPPKVRQSFLSDVPVPRQPNYGDLILMEKPPDDLKFVRDE
jgi:hypothetical protein